jgi:thiamine-phosphate pyrophosphorylase
MSLNRLVDAALNRGGEGLRTLEDLARFLLEDSDLCEALKRLRHELRSVAATVWPDRTPVWARHAGGDVGTAIGTPSEVRRRNLRDVAAAATTRAAEAIRTLEEVAKLDDVPAASALESMRYQLYDLGAAVERRMGSGAAQWRLCLLLTESSCHLPWQHVLEAGLAGGVDCVQVREKHMSSLAMLTRVREVIARCRAADVPVIVNDRVDIALAAGATGVHLGQDDLPIHEARTMCGSRLLVGQSTHGPAEAAAAIEAGADYVGIGPIYTTTTKPELAAAGLDRVRETLAIIGGLPHLAIGGITPDRAQDVFEAGAKGLALGTALCGSADPRAAAEACLHCCSVTQA